MPPSLAADQESMSPEGKAPTPPSLLVTLTSLSSYPRDITLTLGQPCIIGRASKSSEKTHLAASSSNARFESPVVSRNHAQLELVQQPSKMQNDIFIKDNHSLHGTKVNDVPLARNASMLLHEGDRIQLGQEVTRGQDTHRGLTLIYNRPRPPVPAFERPAPAKAGFSVPYYSDDDEDDESDKHSISHISIASDEDTPSSAITSPRDIKRPGSSEHPIDLDADPLQRRPIDITNLFRDELDAVLSHSRSPAKTTTGGSIQVVPETVLDMEEEYSNLDAEELSMSGDDESLIAELRHWSEDEEEEEEAVEHEMSPEEDSRQPSPELGSNVDMAPRPHQLQDTALHFPPQEVTASRTRFDPVHAEDGFTLYHPLDDVLPPADLRSPWTHTIWGPPDQHVRLQPTRPEYSMPMPGPSQHYVNPWGPPPSLGVERRLPWEDRHSPYPIPTQQPHWASNTEPKITKKVAIADIVEQPVAECRNIVEQINKSGVQIQNTTENQAENKTEIELVNERVAAAFNTGLSKKRKADEMLEPEPLPIVEPLCTLRFPEPDLRQSEPDVTQAPTPKKSRIGGAVLVAGTVGGVVAGAAGTMAFLLSPLAERAIGWMA